MVNINFDSNKEPMWGNVGSELQKADPLTGTGWAPDYSSLGFWGGGQALMSAFDQQMKRLANQQESRTKLDVANIGADSANQAQMVQLMKALYGDFPLARATLENKQSNEQMQRQIDIMKMMTGEKTGLAKAKMQADATLGAAQITKEGRVEAASGKVPNVPLAPIEFKGPKMQEIQANAPIDPATKKPIKIPQSELEVLAQKEWINYMTGAKMDVRDTMRQRQQAPAPAAAPQKTSSLSGFPTRPEDIIQMMMTGAVGGGQEPGNDMPSDVGGAAYAAAGVGGAAPDRAARAEIPNVNQSLPPTTSPMSRFASKPGGTEMTRRMYAPVDELVNGAGSVQYAPTYNADKERLSRGGTQDFITANDPRAAARPQSLKNAQDPNFGGLPQPQSEFSRRNPEAFADLLRSQGYVVTDRDIPEGPWVRQGGGGEDTLRAPTPMENPKTREALYSLIFSPTVGPMLSKMMSGGYKSNPRTTGESPILDLLPYLVGGIGGMTGGIMNKAAGIMNKATPASTGENSLATALKGALSQPKPMNPQLNTGDGWGSIGTKIRQDAAGSKYKTMLDSGSKPGMPDYGKAAGMPAQYQEMLNAGSKPGIPDYAVKPEPWFNEGGKYRYRQGNFAGDPTWGDNIKFDPWFKQGGKLKYRQGNFAKDPSWGDPYFNQPNVTSENPRDAATQLMKLLYGM